MRTMLLVPTEGLMELFTYPVDPHTYCQVPLVSVALGREGAQDMTLWMALDPALPENRRATEITYLLSGAYVMVKGAALFDGLDEDQAAAIMMSHEVVP